MKNDVKSRTWAFILYPESAPISWLDILRETGVRISVSPLHNRDVTETGEVKKPHYHIIMCFNNPRHFSSVKKFTDSLNQPIPIRISGNEGVFSLYEYSTHKNDLDKAQYSENDIINLNGFNINDYRVLTDSDLQALKNKIIDFIVEKDITEYWDLIVELKAVDSDMYEYASNHTILFDRLVSSRRHKIQTKEKRQDL